MIAENSYLITKIPGRCLYMAKRNMFMIWLLILTLVVAAGCAKKDTTLTETYNNVAPNAQSTADSLSPTNALQAVPFPGEVGTETAQVLPVTVISLLPDYVADEIVEIKGKTKPGYRVFINGQEAPQKANGEFLFTLRLQVGENEIKVVTISKSKTEDNQTLTIERRPVPPKLTVISPDQSNTEHITISGQTDYGSIVYVDNKPAKPDRKGNFSSTVQLKEGINKIQITSTNSLGGTATAQKTVVFYPGNPRLEVVIPEETRNKQVTISGITDTDTVLVLYVNDMPTNINMQSGVFRGTVTLVEGVNAITVTAINRWGKKTTKSRNIYYSTFS